VGIGASGPPLMTHERVVSIIAEAGRSGLHRTRHLVGVVEMLSVLDVVDVPTLLEALPTLSQATAYRVLRDLERHQLAERVTYPETIHSLWTLTDSARPVRHFRRCDTCGRVAELEMPPLVLQHPDRSAMVLLRGLCDLHW
jgi:Fe2+ or Zn2+ uptake regulation protein